MGRFHRFLSAIWWAQNNPYLILLIFTIIKSIFAKNVSIFTVLFLMFVLHQAKRQVSVKSLKILLQVLLMLFQPLKVLQRVISKLKKLPGRQGVLYEIGL